MAKRHRKGVEPWAAALALFPATWAVALALAPRQQETLPVDRWLVSEPLEAETPTPEAALGAGPLGPEPGLALFPDRDLEIGGVYWHLVRHDGSPLLDLDARFPDRPAPALAYAHAYLRSPAERTVRLRWRGPDCGPVRLRLNAVPLIPLDRDETERGSAASRGSPVSSGGPGDRAPTRSMTVRLAAGWNTLLAEVAAASCPYRLEVWLEPALALDDGEDGGNGGLRGLRVQASRPPGVRRTFPPPFVSAADPVLAPPLRWPAGGAGLVGELRLEVAAWGASAARAEPGPAVPRGTEERPRPGGDFPTEPAPPGGPPEAERRRLAELRDRLLPAPPPPLPAPAAAEIRVVAGGARAERSLEFEAPGRARAAAALLPLDRLERAARSGQIELRASWRAGGDDRRLRGGLPFRPGAVEEALARPIELTGWGETAEGRLEGEWRVPDALAGRQLELLTDGSPGHWRLDGRAVESKPGESITLCAPCAAGSRLRLAVEPGEGWSAPRVRAVAPARAAGPSGS